MFFSGGNATGRRTCLGVLTAAVIWAGWSQAAETAGPVVDSQAWQARFEAWVETALVQDQLDEAAENLPEFDRATIHQLLNELVMKRVVSQRDEPTLEVDVVPPVRARGLDGASLAAARHYASGDIDEALRLLEDPALEADPGAAHLRAQLLDERSQNARPIQKIESIGAYRYALSLAQDSPMARRARLRVGQIFLDLRFIPEAEASLRGLLHDPPTTSDGMAAHIAYAEAAYLNHQSDTAIDTIAKLDPAALAPDAKRWAVQRTADSLFQLGRFPGAIAAYRKAVREAGKNQVSPLLRLRFGAALLQTGKVSQAQTQLRILLTGEAPPQLAARAGLLLARSAREAGSFQEASEAGTQVLQTLPRSPEAALAAVEVLEAERLAGNGDLQLPEEAFELLDPEASTPEFGLLAYRVASTPDSKASDGQVRHWLKDLVQSLPEGAVRKLANEDLSDRLHAHLKQVFEGTSKPDPVVMDEIEKFMRPMLTDENALLVGLETFYRLGRWASCMRWGRALYRREVRPIRRGLGVWREFRCRLAKEPELVSAGRLLEVTDSGKSGAFSLALAALAAEELLRRNELAKGTRVYERALASVAEPRLVGPILLRLGELQLSQGEFKLGTRRVLRGLSLMGDAEISTDPFRKAALIALAHALPHMKAASARDAKRLLKVEFQRANGWWKPAYAYLGFRAGIGSAPEGEDLFSRAAAQLKQANQLESRIKKVDQERERAEIEEDAG